MKHQQGATGRKRGSSLRRRLQLGERKLAYFQSWANEQPMHAYQALAEAVGLEAAEHMRSLQGPVSDAGSSVGGMAAGRLPGGRGAGGAGRPRVLVEEVGAEQELERHVPGVESKLHALALGHGGSGAVPCEEHGSGDDAENLDSCD